MKQRLKLKLKRSLRKPEHPECRTWEAQIETFSKDYRVIALSRRYAYPNRQEENETNDYSVTQHSQDLTQFLKTINVGPVHLVGHSYGAFTALMVTLENPELVKSLILGEPPECRIWVK